MNRVLVSGSFDDVRSRHIRFLQEAARLGPVTVVLWPDELVSRIQGNCKFPLDERWYVLEAIRFVDRVVTSRDLRPNILPLAHVELERGVSREQAGEPQDLIWAVPQGENEEEKREFCAQHGLELRAIPAADLAGFPTAPFDPTHLDPARRRVIVTGCYDWFHSGHVRFFEECSQLGDLYVVVGHDANVRLLKGEGHPFFPEDERRYVAGSCRYVTQALVSSGMGWMDAEPEIDLVKPQMYAVNEDGDKPEKRAFCAEHGIEYVVLRRTPKEGLPRRSSTDLRGY